MVDISRIIPLLVAIYKAFAKFQDITDIRFGGARHSLAGVLYHHGALEDAFAREKASAFGTSVCYDKAIATEKLFARNESVLAFIPAFHRAFHFHRYFDADTRVCALHIILFYIIR